MTVRQARSASDASLSRRSKGYPMSSRVRRIRVRLRRMSMRDGSQFQGRQQARKLPNVQTYEAVTKNLEPAQAGIKLSEAHTPSRTQLVGEHGASSRGNSITDSFLLRCCSQKARSRCQPGVSL
ncbi:Hypothetical_protein [Hexamita inflata]|uniref:Hypothetical_protein n=1 Tax=Hexamita inflata TaxID=28002 RepID=A0AA86P2D2_9EUKA|nr:Hypothetical protein HINF_LOCUS749 [Hexamita inflata]CAI9930346.1 Hypothetical protein HINF_LOCUS17991 [Hexamita inflata]